MQPARDRANPKLFSWPVTWGQPRYRFDRPLLRSLRSAGFDFLRIPFDPGPLLQFNPSQRKQLLAQFSKSLKMAQAEGFDLEVTLMANGGADYNATTLTTEPTRFAQLLTISGEMAEMLGRLPHGRVAFEPLNEPSQCGETASFWAERQRALYDNIRSRTADLPVVITGGCYGKIEGLVALDPTPYLADPHALFTFHYYDPYIFTHGGYAWTDYPPQKYFDALPYPSRRLPKSEAFVSSVERFDQDAQAGDDKDRKSAADRIRKRIDGFVDEDWNRSRIDQDFDKAVAWTQRYGVDRRRVFLGEFGVWRASARFAGARDEDRDRWAADVRVAAEDHGFGWAWVWTHTNFGLLNDDQNDAFNQGLINALGMEPPKVPRTSPR